MEMSLIAIILLGIVEGLTEFIPVSSTGHLILASQIMAIPKDATFDIVIQLGAILAVVVLYWRRFYDVAIGLFARDAGAWRFTRNILLGFLPSAIVGAIAYGAIKAVLEAPQIGAIVVSIALLVGGILILLIERVQKTVTTETVEAMGWKTALGIGIIQCLSMIPGISRSGATIMGALSLGVERKTAAEYSFFLAIPTMLGATTLALWKARHEVGPIHWSAIGIGFAVSFVVAIVVIRWFIGIVSRFGFAPFAWYRIVVGSVALAWLLAR